jgi:hypothetical protein
MKIFLNFFRFHEDEWVTKGNRLAVTRDVMMIALQRLDQVNKTKLWKSTWVVKSLLYFPALGKSIGMNRSKRISNQEMNFGQQMSDHFWTSIKIRKGIFYHSRVCSRHACKNKHFCDRFLSELLMPWVPPKPRFTESPWMWQLQGKSNYQSKMTA